MSIKRSRRVMQSTNAEATALKLLILESIAAASAKTEELSEPYESYESEETDVPDVQDDFVPYDKARDLDAGMIYHNVLGEPYHDRIGGEIMDTHLVGASEE